ncbi:MAG: acetyl-CoA carboxylase, biotin carboxyl carrier protein [Chitinophagales bacterium]|nr:MAG: acetyl-CoA carboxylase, biotin carboxyl carrier protein [Chitinophagales bacterium]
MDFKQIQELIKIMGKSDLTELKIEQESFKITLRKGTAMPLIPSAVQPQAPKNVLQENTITPPPVETGTQEKTDSDKAAANKYITIKSPMVGTFYRAPAPDKEPYVKVGDIIKKGDHICIIEAMKLFNEIESEVDGKVVKILVEDASPVEYDQPLFLIDPEGV